MEEYTQSNYHFIRLIIKQKRLFILVTLIAGIAAAVFSSELFIKPKYKSFATVYPSNIIPYGQESPAEQMLQLLGSDEIRNSVVRKFNLIRRYGIDTTLKAGKDALIAAYESNVAVNRTQFESIEIKVLDVDPQVASDMVKEIIDGLNLKARALQRSKTKEVFVIMSNQLNNKKRQLDSLGSILENLRIKYQILDYGIQAKEVIRGYMKALTDGKGRMQDVDMMMKNLEEKGGEYYSTKTIYDAELETYTKFKYDYDNTYRDLNKELTYTNVVIAPEPSDKKVYPVRWLIVLASVASAGLFLFVMLLVMDAGKKITQ